MKNLFLNSILPYTNIGIVCQYSTSFNETFYLFNEIFFLCYEIFYQTLINIELYSPGIQMGRCAYARIISVHSYEVILHSSYTKLQIHVRGKQVVMLLNTCSVCAIATTATPLLSRSQIINKYWSFAVLYFNLAEIHFLLPKITILVHI